MREYEVFFCTGFALSGRPAWLTAMARRRLACLTAVISPLASFRWIRALKKLCPWCVGVVSDGGMMCIIS